MSICLQVILLPKYGVIDVYRHILDVAKASIGGGGGHSNAQKKMTNVLRLLNAKEVRK